MLLTLKSSKASSGLVGALSALREQNIAFAGPFRTAKGRIVFRIQDQIVLESELLDLFSIGNLNPAGITALLQTLRAHRTLS